MKHDLADEQGAQPYTIHDGLAIYRLGAGAPLLFMPYPHANRVVGDAALMTLLAGLAGLGRQVLTFDPPASGRSSRPARLDMPEMIACAEETLELCGIDGPADVFGHSQGGVAALSFAIERPARVRRLVLANTAAGGPSFMRAPGAIWNRSHPDHWRFGLYAMLYALSRRRAAEKLMLNLIGRVSLVDRSLARPEPIDLGDWLRPARPRTWWGQRTARHTDERARLGQVLAPTLVLAGRHDRQMPPDCARELAQGIPGARLAIFERSGHYPYLEERDAFWAAVGAFLQHGPEPQVRPDKHGRSAPP